MPAPREIFRRKALDHYQLRPVTPVHPHFFSHCVPFFCWITFFLILGSVLITCSWKTTQFAHGFGIVQNVSNGDAAAHGSAVPPQQVQTLATLFFPQQFGQEIRAGAQVQMRFNGAEQVINGRIEHVDPAVLKPEEARQRYHLSGQIAITLSSPVIVAFATVSPANTPGITMGSSVDALLQIGTWNLFSLFKDAKLW